MLTEYDARTLATLLRLGDPRAVRRVRAAMRDSGGCVQDAARALGVSRRALTQWLSGMPALAGVRRQGRAGSVRAMLSARGVSTH